MYSNVYYRLNFPEPKKQFIYAPLDPFNPKTRQVEREALDVGLRQHDMIQNKMLQNVGLFDGSLINGNVFDEVKDSDARGFLGSDYFRKFVVEFIADYRKTKQIKTLEDRKALITKLTEELNRGLQPNEVEILDQALMGIDLGPSPQPAQAPPASAPPVQAPPVVQQAPQTQPTAIPTATSTSSPAVLESEADFDDRMKKLQKEVFDLYDNGNVKESFEKEKVIIELLIDREKQTTNDPKRIKKLEKNLKRLDDKIAQIGVPLGRNVESEVNLLYKTHGKPNPANVTLRVENSKFMVGKSVVTFVDTKLIFNKEDGTFYERADPSTGYLKLLTINDANILKQEKDITPDDIREYLFDLAQIGLNLRGKSGKVEWLKPFVGKGLKAKKVTKKNAKKPAKKAKSTASINHYKNPKELITRMKILVGEQRGGNNSPDVVNEIAEIADELLKGDVISKSEHRVIYSKYVL